MIGRAALIGAVLALVAASPASALTLDYVITGTAGQNGWFVGPVKVKWDYSGEDGTSGCDTKTLTSDTEGVQITCSAYAGAESITRMTPPIRIDTTKPAGVTALAARPPDASPWYTAPLPITWSGTDAPSGIASCTVLSYAGPDTANAAPAGTCRDRAGNESAPVTLTFAYDATAPSLSDVIATAAPGEAVVHWAPGPDVQRVTVTREPGDAEATSKVIADGPQGASDIADRGLVGGKGYIWTVTVRDAAGNATSARASATPPLPARAASAQKPSGPPTLHWTRRANAKYYNFQLLRRGRKVLSAWPSRPSYAVRTSWRFRGKRHTLVAGTYAWYVWPGYGPRALRRYGRLLAHGTFTVR